ncbi:3-oxoacyl-ACP reductase FabG [Aestuariirhabdus sp. Z084]|uniref:3-oxoacyl-ACP reductase FabG n=1 Tax=Aestuariirhabdus haliotis TaxID=2918751 RepID=UPI00201B3D1C|nr:3-oxoacyl-ACP reductase FabG [Aestuariirhabdus haliotis]MCL6414802.1 3-oxoacyl-ACP reductase FabG [Aestuariirhabdus haliotis]MCL6418734.1 3-oxoacyl-ACP reductase FabG [Aestuariirhabdus haliotis]
MSLNGKVALVTGASRGIGQAISLELGRLGATVIGTATSDAGAEKISATLREQGITGCGMTLNVCDDASIAAIVKAITEQYEAPQILVNNAGITQDNILMRMKDAQWDDVINTNLSSIFKLSKACLRGMTKARWGRIINISSVVGSMGNLGQTNYAAAKAGVEGFSRSLAREIGSRGITVNSVAPGFIDTDMTKELPDEHKEHMLAQIPAARLGRPEEIAAAVAFLAGEGGGYVTGETLHVNGGMYMS